MLRRTLVPKTAAALLGLGLAAAACAATIATSPLWSAEERELLAAMRLSALEPLPNDPSNRVADDAGAVALGHRLFFDKRLSSTGTVSCASCHDPARDFQDGTALAKGVGTTDRRTMPIASAAWSPWQFWDGRKDSQWAQALGPLESPVEHGGTRALYAQVIAKYYREAYEEVFGTAPSTSGQDATTRVFVNIGKSIAAYERRIQYGPARFDRYVDTLVATGHAPSGILTSDEVAGLKLFIGKGNCVNCHNGALFTDNHFHNTGVPAQPGLPNDAGRATGATAALNDEFNCLSNWSDASPAECKELTFIVADGHELVRAYKTPSLRNVANRPPYMHAGQIANLDAVISHYNNAPRAPQGHSELRRLKLSAREQKQLVAFLHTLTAPLSTPRHLLENPHR